MRYYYRLMIAVAAAVALGAMAAFGGGSAEAHGPDHNWRYYLNAAGVCVADGHTHRGQGVGEQVIGIKASDPTRCATPTPTPTPEAPPAELRAPAEVVSRCLEWRNERLAEGGLYTHCVRRTTAAP